MEQKRITQRLVQVLEEEFNMRDAMSIPSKKPEDITVRFFSDDEEHLLHISKITQRKGKR